MDLFIAIALLCAENGPTLSLRCQQSYIHCVNVKTITMTQQEALTKCIMEKK